MTTGRYPKLAQFLGAYFHQDWPQEHPDSPSVVKAYVAQAKPATLKSLQEEIDGLLSESLKEAELGRRLEALGSCFDPASERQTHKAWLTWLGKSLTAPSKPVSKSRS